MNLYIAGNYQHDRSTVAEIAGILEQHGHTITFKWCSDTTRSATVGRTFPTPTLGER